MIGRLPVLRPAELSAEQRAVYDSVVGGPRGAGPQAFPLTDAEGGLTGPFNAMLFSPGVGAALQELGAAIRFRGGLSARVRELAILLVAAKWDSDFERYAHEAVGRGIGLTGAELAAARAGTVPDSADGAERAALELVVAMLDGDVDQALWGRAAAVLDHRTMVEVSTLVGYYATLALQLRVFRVGVPG
ncbi:MAG TPA: carboxymuconolactone decarboxylase family protein [Pseudonocardiaceae bacterium]|jgi:4-carboxymuconolactone decarboxylase|nr:carboxymuconolactone decarboxylase family protein [Pseudonocardiaceae bacterium]